MKDFSFGCRRLLPKNVERIRVPLNYVDIIEKNIYNIDSKICGIIDDYKILHDSQKVADYVIQFLRTYLETIAARIYAYENPDKPTPIRGKDKWYTQYIKALKETNEYGYIWMFHHSLQIVTSHYVPAEDGAVRFMEGHINLLYQLRNHMREMFGLNLMENLEDYPQERNEELNPYYRKIYNSLREIQVEESAEHTKDRYYIMRKKYRFVDGRGFFEYTLAYAQEEITKFDRFVVYSFSDIPDNYSIQCDFAHTSVDFNGIDIDIKCLVAWTVSIRPCELEKIAAIAGYEVTVRSYNTFYRAMMKFLSKKGMNLLDILLADENDYDIYSEQVQIGQTSKFAEVFNKLRDIIINDKSGCNIIRYLISFLRNDVIRDQLADCPNNRLSYLYLKNEAIGWGNWVYKVGDKVLFNDNKRFGSVLYNNLKGTIVTIDRKDEEIVFQIQIDKKISDRDIFYTDLKLHDCACEGKSIVEFSVKKRIEKDSDTDYSEQVVPFQIAYAVSIHKAQGLEYKSVKVVITEDVDEQISHNIFYTAITRTTDNEIMESMPIPLFDNASDDLGDEDIKALIKDYVRRTKKN